MSDNEKNKKKCFIIMPLTTPETTFETYNNDNNHFINVLKYLFVPILEALDFEVIKPIAEGSESIPIKIIKNLIEADLVLCDISIHNPNVFFELGIRTALNKPVCIVKDSKTSKIPFDTNTINIETYDSDLSPWIIETSIKILTNHITNTIQSSNDKNSLWESFGFNIALNQNFDISENDEIKYLQLQNKYLEMKVGQIESEKKITSEVMMTSGSYHKCQNCGYGYNISNLPLGISTRSYSTAISISSIINPSSLNTFTNGVRCPKCGNYEEI